MKPFRWTLRSIIVVASLAAMTSQAQVMAPQSVPLRDALQGLVTEAGTQCPKMAATLRAEKDKYDANNFWFAQEYQNSLCQCQPARVKSLLAQRPAAELDAIVNAQQAMDYVMVNATSPCVGKVFRELLGGKQCKAYMDAAVCACLAPEVAKMADNDLLKAGIAYKEYRDALARAKAAGKPGPAIPAAAASLVKTTERCARPAG